MLVNNIHRLPHTALLCNLWISITNMGAAVWVGVCGHRNQSIFFFRSAQSVHHLSISVPLSHWITSLKIFSHHWSFHEHWGWTQDFNAQRRQLQSPLLKNDHRGGTLCICIYLPYSHLKPSLLFKNRIYFSKSAPVPVVFTFNYCSVALAYGYWSHSFSDF